MKHLLALTAFIMVAIFTATANVLTPEEALARALPTNSAMSTGTTPHYSLAATRTIDKAPTTYVFDAEVGQGYLVVSADENAAPLLGFSTTGKYDAANPNLSYWLNEYDRQIAESRVSKEVFQPPRRAAELGQAIAPMVETRWNQNAPYNNMCPQYNGKQCYTGCVATAMAQVMNYHRWPEKGVGTNSYTWKDETLSIDFSKVTFDWDNMLDVYTSSATEAQNDAVASLMYACGMSVNMNYGTSGSGAVSFNITHALVDHFNYDKGVEYLQRNYYGIDEWEQIIYDQLKNVGPVLYGGQSGDGGHEFVCDGYSSGGYFHFNWGWGGMSDGYFLLTALDPGSQGIGGSSSGYNFMQDIVIGVQPPTDESAYAVNFLSSYDFTINSGSTTLGSPVEFTTALSNLGLVSVDFTVELSITSEDGQVSYAKWPYSNNLSLGSQYSYGKINVVNNLPASLADGSYIVRPCVLTSDGKHTPVQFKVDKNSFATMKVEGDSVTFYQEPKGYPEIEEITFDSDLYSGQPFGVSAELVNEYDSEYYGTIYGIFNNGSKTYTVITQQIDIEGDDTDDFQSTGTLKNVPAGNYTFYYAVNKNGNIIKISDEVNADVLSAPAASVVTASSVSFAGGANHVDKDDLKATVTINCTEGVFYGSVDLVIFRNAEGDEYSSVATFESEMLYLNAGESKTVNFDVAFPEGEEGHQYAAFVYDGNDAISSWNFFTIGDLSTGVDTADADDIVSTELFTLAGVPVTSATPAPGLYIEVSHHADGTATSARRLMN